MRAMTDDLGTGAELGWPQTLDPKKGTGSEGIAAFIQEGLLPHLGDLNRPKKILEQSGLMWGAAKKQGVQSALVADGFRVYMRNGAVVGGRQEIRTSVSSDLAEQAQQAKSRVKRYLGVGGVPVPLGRTFSPTLYTEAAQYAEALGWDVVIKPEARTEGRGVCTLVGEAQRFRTCWDEVTAQSDGHILIEERRKGLPLRAFVGGERVVGVLVTLPMFVVGDGQLTLRQLGERLLIWRAQNVFLRRMNPTEDELKGRMRQLWLEPEAIPEAGEVILLQQSPDMRHGALSVDVTNLLSEELGELIVNAAWTVPGLRAGGVDVVAPSLESAEGAVIVGVDSRASIQLHEYPSFGKSRPVAGAVMTQFLASARGS